MHFTYQVNKFTLCVRDFFKLISASVLKRYLSKFTHLDIVERGIKPLQRGNKTPPDKISWFKYGTVATLQTPFWTGCSWRLFTNTLQKLGSSSSNNYAHFFQWIDRQNVAMSWKLTSSLRIISICSLLLNSSHSSLYRSISSLVWRIFFFNTSRREPCWMFVVIFTHLDTHSNFSSNKTEISAEQCVW